MIPIITFEFLDPYKYQARIPNIKPTNNNLKKSEEDSNLGSTMSTKNILKMTKIINKLARFIQKPDSTDKGHFAVYTTDMRRFMVPLVCLEDEIFRELLKLSEDEFGLPCEGPIMLPCDACFVEYLISLINQGSAGDLEKALILSVVTSRCSSPPDSDLQHQTVC